MILHENDLALVPDLLDAELLEDFERVRRAQVMTHDQIGIAPEDFAGTARFDPGMGCEDFFDNGLSHRSTGTATLQYVSWAFQH
jgi:hypothetical protein